MTNKLNERRSNAIIIVAVVCSLAFIVVGLLSGLAAGLGRKQRDNAPQSQMSHYLLVDAADGLRHASSALRLCNEQETASEISTRALVYIVRAETALECEGEMWSECLDCESFLNDAATVLSSSDVESAVQTADTLYTLSCKFYKHVKEGAPFEYDGQLIPNKANGENRDEGDTSASAQKIIDDVLGFAELQQVGAYDGVTEFASETCYATVRGGKLTEFAFSSGGVKADGDDAQAAAEELAARCGFDDLYVYSTNETEGVTTVKLCDRQGGAYCRDECATVVIADGKARAFSAGHCGNKHDVPSAKVDEATARKSSPEKFVSELSGEGRLVTTFDGERDRICYEYRYVLDDGEHFVYVCAENGKQMQVR